ncbi:MAG TPA: Crp/Fnr family transcriptional regulator [Balneolaceae bacterium]
MNRIQHLPLEDKLKAEIEALCSIVDVDKDKSIVQEGTFMQVIPLLLKGSIRVFRRDYDLDREILLYYINPGETCMMSLVACFGDAVSKVNAVTEKKSELLMIPTAKVRDWQKEFHTWNSFVINTFMNRYTELLFTLNEISFRKIDQRLQNYLKNYSDRQCTKTVKLTHQELANELGTTRVVISRLLKNLENMGLVELQRGLIKLKS